MQYFVLKSGGQKRTEHLVSRMTKKQKKKKKKKKKANYNKHTNNQTNNKKKKRKNKTKIQQQENRRNGKIAGPVGFGPPTSKIPWQLVFEEETGHVRLLCFLF